MGKRDEVGEKSVVGFGQPGEVTLVLVSLHGEGDFELIGAEEISEKRFLIVGDTESVESRGDFPAQLEKRASGGRT